MRTLSIAAALAGAMPASVLAQGLPPVPPELARASAVSCIRIDDSGAVSGAFLLTSTGSKAGDRALIAWLKQLRWPKAEPGDKGRNAWFPMPVAFGGTPPPEAPPRCAPKHGSGEA